MKMTLHIYNIWNHNGCVREWRRKQWGVKTFANWKNWILTIILWKRVYFSRHVSIPIQFNVFLYGVARWIWCCHLSIIIACVKVYTSAFKLICILCMAASTYCHHKNRLFTRDSLKNQLIYLTIESVTVLACNINDPIGIFHTFIQCLLFIKQKWQ